MKKFLYYVLGFTALFIIFQKNVHAAGAFGDECNDYCSCCQILMDEFEYFNPVTTEQDAINNICTWAGAYPSAYAQTVYQELCDRYADTLGKAWLYAHGYESAYRLCYWGTYGAVCGTEGADCPLPGESTCPQAVWTDSIYTGYQQQAEPIAICNDCYPTNNITYRCDNGYYGRPTTTPSGCQKCVTPGTSVAGSTSITSCYIPANSTLSDATGSGIYTSNCYYTN